MKWNQTILLNQIKQNQTMLLNLEWNQTKANQIKPNQIKLYLYSTFSTNVT